MTSTLNTIESATPCYDAQLASDQIIKTDRLGRIRIKPEHREALLDKFEQSGMSGQQFAKQYGVKYTTFAHWCQKRRRNKASHLEGINIDDHQIVNSLTEVVARGRQPSAAIKLTLGHNVELSLSSEGQIPLVAKLIKALQSHVS